MKIEIGESDEVLDEVFGEALNRAFQPPVIIDVDRWAETNRVLTTEESPLPGRYRVSAVEVARGPLLAATEPGVEMIVIKSAAQLMKTSTIQNILGWIIATRPAPVLLYQPTEDTANKFSSSKLTPMMKSTPALTKALGGSAALSKKSSTNKVAEKKFLGGWYAVLSASSENSFGMHTIVYGFGDEISKWKPIKGVANQVDLLLQRSEFAEGSRLNVLVSTPKEEGDCEVSARIHDSDRRMPYVACPACDHLHSYVWSDVRWDKDEADRGLPETAHLECPECSHAWTEAERLMALTTEGAVTWRQTRPFTCCGVNQNPSETRSWTKVSRSNYHAACTECGATPVSNKIAGFDKASALFSPIRPLSARVEEFLKAKGDPAKMQKFVNEVLAEPWKTSREDTSFEADPDALASRLEVPWNRVPGQVQVVTAGVDTQDDRLEVEIVGWGAGMETWSLDYHVIHGCPSDPAVWEQLDQILLAPMQTEDGRTIRVAATCIDTGGHYTDVVHRFCGMRNRRRVWAIQGGNFKDFRHRQPVWPAAMSKTIKFKSRLHNIGTNLAKDIVARMMSATTPGPYYMHVPERQGVKAWIKSLMTERRVSFLENGLRASRWVHGKGNEAMDCRVYALAAHEGLIATGGHRKGIIEAPGAAVGETGRPLPPVPVASASTDGAPPPPPPPAPKKKRPPPRRSPGGFGGVGGFGGGFGRGGFSR